LAMYRSCLFEKSLVLDFGSNYEVYA